MKRILLTLAIALVASAASAQYVDDLYGPAPARKKKVEKVEQAVTEHNSATNSSYNQYAEQYQATNGTNEELITSYENALERRLNALRSYSEQSESYWQLMEQYQAVLEKKYNQNLYNIVVVGSDMWVEPQSITALFDGTDPAAGVIKYNNEIRTQLNQQQKSSLNSYESRETASNVTIQVNVVDPWDYWWGGPSYYGSSWRYWGGYYPSYWDGYYGGYWGGYYPGYWGPSWGYYPGYWGSHWGGGHWHDYGHSYYNSGNPRGTYYGNSRYSSGSRSSSSGMGGGRGTLRANGNNTVYNGRSSGMSGGNRQSSISRPAGLGGVTTTRPMRSQGSSTSRPAFDRPGIERPTTYTRPSTTQRTSTYERPSTTERTSSYDRPSTPARSSSYDRPSTPARSSSYDRPSSSGRSSGGSSSSGSSSGGMGGGRSGGGGGGRR